MAWIAVDVVRLPDGPAVRAARERLAAGLAAATRAAQGGAAGSPVGGVAIAGPTRVGRQSAGLAGVGLAGAATGRGFRRTVAAGAFGEAEARALTEDAHGSLTQAVSAARRRR